MLTLDLAVASFVAALIVDTGVLSAMATVICLRRREPTGVSITFITHGQEPSEMIDPEIAAIADAIAGLPQKYAEDKAAAVLAAVAAEREAHASEISTMTADHAEEVAALKAAVATATPVVAQSEAQV